MIGPLLVTQAFAPLLGTDNKRTGPMGRIVNISSSAAKVAIPLLGAYTASKWGLEGMSEALRRELTLFGIDLVIIEPGAVNTAMYDKGETEDLSEFKTTPYWEAVQNFQKYVVGEGRRGLSPERLGKAVYVALTTAKPRARYAAVPQRFKNWTLPRLLPPRMLDAAISKQMGPNQKVAARKTETEHPMLLKFRRSTGLEFALQKPRLRRVARQLQGFFKTTPCFLLASRQAMELSLGRGIERVVLELGKAGDLFEFHQSPFRSLGLSYRDRPVQGHDGRGFQPVQQVVKFLNAAPVRLPVGLRAAMQRRDGRLQMELAQFLSRGGPLEKVKSLPDQGPIPLRAVLTFQLNQDAFRIHAPRQARGVEAKESEKSEGLGTGSLGMLA